MPDINIRGKPELHDIATLNQQMEKYRATAKENADSVDHRRMQYDIHGRREILDSCGMPVKAGDLVYVGEEDEHGRINRGGSHKTLRASCSGRFLQVAEVNPGSFLPIVVNVPGQTLSTGLILSPQVRLGSYEVIVIQPGEEQHGESSVDQ